MAIGRNELPMLNLGICKIRCKMSNIGTSASNVDILLNKYKDI